MSPRFAPRFAPLLAAALLRCAVAALLACAGASLLLCPGAAHAGSDSHAKLKIQLGWHRNVLASHDVTREFPRAHLSNDGVLAAISWLSGAQGRRSLGAGFEMEGNQLFIDPQEFGIATIRLLGEAQIRLRESDPVETPGHWPLRPYLLACAGWNQPGVGARVEYPLGAIPGIVTGMHLSGGPAARLALGVDRRVAQAGLRLNLEAGWNLNRGRYHIHVSGSPDETGTLRLDGLHVLGGITLVPPTGSW